MPTQSDKILKAVEDDLGIYVGYTSALVNNVKLDDDVKPEVIPNKLCDCGGTGFTMSGDGLMKIKCVCDNNCKCDKPDTKNTKCNCGCGKTNCHCSKSATGCAVPVELEDDKKTFTYYFSAEWCGPCKNFKKTDVPKLEASGWKFGKDKYEKNLNVIFIDIDKNSELWKKFGDFDKDGVGALPNVVVIKNGKKIASYSGYMNYLDFGNFVIKAVESSNK
jgi:thiol-disulfide isomerase/thioredoxin